MPETQTLDHSIVRRLAGFVGERAPVTTCYLDVDGRRSPRQLDLEHRVGVLVRQARSSLNGSAQASVQTDLSRIEDYVRAGFERGDTRGLAFFACDAHGLFEVVHLPVPVRDAVVVNHSPAVGQLEGVLQEYEPIGVLLVDKTRARMFVFELGTLTERSEFAEAAVRGDAGHADRGDLSNPAEEAQHAHARHAAALAWHVYGDHPFVHLALGAPDAMAAEVEANLHPYLAERLRGRLKVSPASSPESLRQAVLDFETQVERERERAVVARLLDAAARNDRAVTGLSAVLGAISEHRVERLVVSDGYAQEGWRCPSTGALALRGPASPVTGEPMDRVSDVVECAIESAIAHGARVEVCVGNADLDVHGRIGALLRY